MNENLILTKESVPSDIERYFRGVLALDQQDKVFSVNLDDVWQLAYSERGKAIRALKANFIENVDFLPIARNGENSPAHNGKQDWGGNNKVDYYLTSACLEYFIARKVRPVFEVYRRVFHHAVAQVQQQPSLQEQVQAKLAFADWSAKFLNLNDASKLGMAQKIDCLKNHRNHNGSRDKLSSQIILNLNNIQPSIISVGGCFFCAFLLFFEPFLFA